MQTFTKQSLLNDCVKSEKKMRQIVCIHLVLVVSFSADISQNSLVTAIWPDDLFEALSFCLILANICFTSFSKNFIWFRKYTSLSFIANDMKWLVPFWAANAFLCHCCVFGIICLLICLSWFWLTFLFLFGRFFMSIELVDDTVAHTNYYRSNWPLPCKMKCVYFVLLWHWTWIKYFQCGVRFTCIPFCSGIRVSLLLLRFFQV